MARLVLLQEVNRAIDEFLSAMSDYVDGHGDFPGDQVNRMCRALESSGAWLIENASAISGDTGVEDQLAGCWINIFRLQCALDGLASRRDAAGVPPFSPTTVAQASESHGRA